ncbi:MAG: mechanosensitive ion channel family protein [Ignavibacteriales bacterium]|nr:mechanosensitive ion channel family protein [Ignavibacteriales bacterium]
MLESIKNIIAKYNWEAMLQTAIQIVIILIVAWVLTKLAQKFLKRLEKNLIHKSKKDGEPPSESEKRISTVVRLLRQGFFLAIWIIAFMVVLKEVGVDIGPIIAGAGIIGLAVGFGAQNLVRDIISGFFIILENQIRVGDVAVINGTGGAVERINFRTIVLRDLSGTVHIFPNGTITTLSNMTNEWSAYVFEIGVAYKENTDHVIEIIKDVGKKLHADENFKDLMLEEVDIFGVDKLGDSAVIIKGRIKTQPVRQWAVGREFLRRVKYALDENNIEIPFPHQTIYFGEESKPFDLNVTNGSDKQNKLSN